MKLTQAYIDMDGVLADFFKSALLVNHVDCSAINYPKGQYNIEKWLGVKTEYFWERIDDHGEGFWSGLDLCEGALELWEIVQPLNPIILTSPSMQPHCVSGKLKWLQSTFGNQFRDYIFCPAQHKLHLAKEHCLLVDDRETNVRDFYAVGGQAYLWPHIGNNSAATINDALSDIKIMVEANA